MALLLSVLPLPALAAPPVITSGAPDKVAVTLYRDPDRGDGAIDRSDPTSFALIVETRTVILPPGEIVVRFEGVASGIVPQSCSAPPPASETAMPRCCRKRAWSIASPASA